SVDHTHRRRPASECAEEVAPREEQLRTAREVPRAVAGELHRAVDPVARLLVDADAEERREVDAEAQSALRVDVAIVAEAESGEAVEIEMHALTHEGEHEPRLGLGLELAVAAAPEAVDLEFLECGERPAARAIAEQSNERCRRRSELSGDV